PLHTADQEIVHLEGSVRRPRSAYLHLRAVELRDGRQVRADERDRAAVAGVETHSTEDFRCLMNESIKRDEHGLLGRRHGRRLVAGRKGGGGRRCGGEPGGSEDGEESSGRHVCSPMRIWWLGPAGRSHGSAVLLSTTWGVARSRQRA